MKTLRRGDEGEAVRELQRALNDWRCANAGTFDSNEGFFDELRVDGDFGPKTEETVELFQEAVGLLDDGIAGRRTWDALGYNYKPNTTVSFELPDFEGWERVLGLDPVEVRKDTSAASCSLRPDIAEKLRRVVDEVHAAGGKFATSGAKRRLSANVSKNRSATSLHYLGRAIDLFLPAGMENPSTDLFVIERDPENPRKWIVWVRADEGEERVLNGWVHAEQGARRVTGRFVNLTEIFAKHGFKRISSRRSYNAGNYGGSEWWHFQNEDGLVAGATHFGEELLKVWSREELEASSVWDARDEIFGVDWR